jgi:hypothetical protein
MHNIFKFIFLSTLYYLSYAFNQHLPLKDASTISRRNICILIGASVILPKNVRAEEENKPLTPEEMEEYNRLLKEAERIKSIIDANKKSLIGDDEENGIKKYWNQKKRNITNVE